MDAAAELQRRWAGTGNQILFVTTGQIVLMDIQRRSEYARPRNGFAALPVRQAFYQAVDRQVLTDVVTHGLAPVADSWVYPGDPRRAELESWIPQFPYDPAPPASF